jgi:hypothetical protein
VIADSQMRNDVLCGALARSMRRGMPAQRLKVRSEFDVFEHMFDN